MEKKEKEKLRTFRVVRTDTWKMKFFKELDTEEKLLYLYLQTNEFTNQSGVYNLEPEIMAIQTKVKLDKVNSFLKKMEKEGLLFRSTITEEIAVTNFLEEQIVKGGAPIECAIRSGLNQIQDRKLIQKLFEKLQEEGISKIKAPSLVSYLLDNLAKLRKGELINKMEIKEKTISKEDIELINSEENYFDNPF